MGHRYATAPLHIRTAFVVGLVMAPAAALAQRSAPSPPSPLALATRGALPLSAVGALRLPPLDNDALQARDDGRTADPTVPAPHRFAEGVDLSASPATHGTWETLASGARVWRLLVESRGAYSLNFGFARFRLPDGAALWVYPAEGAPEVRAFTAADNEGHGELWTPIVPGARAVVELDLPAAKAGDEPSFELVLGRVGHAYRPAFLRPDEVAAMEARSGDGGVSATSGSCNVDVVCPEGDPYRDVIRSVGAYTRGGSDLCSGVAVNNTAGDGRPLFLTADHCGTTEANAPSAVVYWNYENSTCRPPGSPENGGPGDGQHDEFNSGAVLLARGGYYDGDWALLEFDDPILPEAGVFLAGWDRRDLPAPSGVAIHHPGVEEKRITFEHDPIPIPQAAPQFHYVQDWDVGTVQPGSSGSPLFNPERRVLGVLHGANGPSACDGVSTASYGRIGWAMQNGSRLRTLLDPLGANAATLDGREADAPMHATMRAEPGVVSPGDTLRITVVVRNVSDAPLVGVSYTHALPSQLSYAGALVASAGSASADGNTIRWDADLAPHACDSLAFDVRMGESTPNGFVETVAYVIHPGLLNSYRLDAWIEWRTAGLWEFTNDEAQWIFDGACGWGKYTSSTIVVPDPHHVDSVRVGVTIEAPYRDDLVVELFSPSGRRGTLLGRVGYGAANLDALFTDDGPPDAFASGNHDVATPFFEVEGQSEREPLSHFAGTNAEGVWTLQVCDSEPNNNYIRLLRWSLQIYTAPPVEAAPVPALPLEALTVEAARPNPARGPVSLRLAVGRPQSVRATLHDALGRLVATLFEGPVASAHALRVETAGLPAGAYFVRVAGEASAAMRPFTVVR